MKIIAIIASYNEERFIRICLEHYLTQGIYVYLLDNESTDATVEIAKEYLGRNLIYIETLPRQGMFQSDAILKRKEELADELDADWLLHADVDEIRLSHEIGETLAEAVERVDSLGFNAINFMEYTFIPVIESPDHDHADFQKTMLWYYPFSPIHPHRLNLWKKQKKRWPGIKSFIRQIVNSRRLRFSTVNLRDSGGHIVKFTGIQPYPQDFILKHYQVLSIDHAIQKYVHKAFDPNEVSRGQHGWRASVKDCDIALPSESAMRFFSSDKELDVSNPLTRHLLVNQNENFK